MRPPATPCRGDAVPTGSDPKMRHARRLASAALSVLVAVSASTAVASAQEGDAPRDTTPPQDTEFVYIDSQAILQQAPGASEAQQTWSRELAQYRSEVQQLATEIDTMQSNLEQQRDMLNQSAIDRRRQEIAEKQQELRQRAQELEQRAAQRQQELLGPILEEVRAVIDEIREEQGYTMVFDASAAGVLAADPRLDITGLVLERLQERQARASSGS